MPTPLLKTKIYIPDLSTNLVARTRLCKQLDQGLAGKLSLVAAPAGFGKTTLISSWIRTRFHSSAWFSLDQGDNDPSVFWAYVVNGLQQACQRHSQALLPAFNPTQLPPISSLLISLINELAVSQQKIVLVLDDYHVISNPAIHQQMDFLIDKLPPQLHIILSTRADPPLPLARLRAKSQLCEIRADSLRFTISEASTFLNDILALELDSADIEALDKRTEGWAAGLQLAALSMRDRTDKHTFITDFSGSHHYILEYLTEEVINRLPEIQRRFLLQTSILDSFCADLCEQVVEITDSNIQLAALLHGNLFLVPLDDEQQWYRYHHLFADLLKNRLQQEFHPNQILDLYQRAGQWYQDQGDLLQAINYYLSAQEFSLAADLIEQAASSTMLYGRITSLLHWIELLPDTCLETRPRVRFYQAWAFSLGGQPKVAEKILEDAKSALASLPGSPENQALRGELSALLTGIITYYNDPSRVIQEAQEALNFLPLGNFSARARVHIALGTAYAYSDEMEKATQMYQLARDLALKATNPFLAAAAVEFLAGMQIYHLGLLHSAQQNLEQILELAKSKDGTYQPFAGTAHILLAAIYLEWNDLEGAARYLEKGFELFQQGGIGYSLAYAHCTKSRLHLAQRENHAAVEALRQAQQAAQDAPLMHILIHNLACQTKLALHLGDIGKASRWVEMNDGLPEDLPMYLREVQQIAFARVCLAKDEFAKSLEICNHLLPPATSARRIAHIIEIYLLKALTYQQQGDTLNAINALKQSISHAVTEGYQRIFLEEGRRISKLLQWIAGSEFNLQYVNQLLAALDAEIVQPRQSMKPHLQTPSQVSMAEPLSERECAVLKLIAAGYTNQQIADHLVISLNTVKKHTTHIYGKLGVKNRAQAIAQARDYKLIS